MTGIYKITNSINNKVYIGQSTDIERRWKEHKQYSKIKDNGSYIHNSIFKHGVDNFIFEVVLECPISELDKMEMLYIKQYNSIQEGYAATGRKYGVVAETIRYWCKSYGLPKYKNEIIELYNSIK